jgi:hypothetical protein
MSKTKKTCLTGFSENKKKANRPSGKNEAIGQVIRTEVRTTVQIPQGGLLVH